MTNLFDLKERYELVRAPIPADRWEHVYGWEHDQAIRMDGTSSEVRLYYVADDGERREIDGHVGSKFEFGYGGTGPHESARAIVDDFRGRGGEEAPAKLRELVPEVFMRPHDAERCLVLIASLKERILCAQSG